MENNLSGMFSQLLESLDRTIMNGDGGFKDDININQTQAPIKNDNDDSIKTIESKLNTIIEILERIEKHLTSQPMFNYIISE